MKQANAADKAKEDKRMSIPKEVVIREHRLKAIEGTKQKILARSAEPYERAKEDYDEKIRKREEKSKGTGKKSKGKMPVPPVEGPRDKGQVNLTAEECP